MFTSSGPYFTMKPRNNPPAPPFKRMTIMPFRALLALPLAVLISAIAAPVGAGYEDDQKACQSTETKTRTDEGIAACGRQIEAKTRELAVSYHNRGLFWFGKKDFDKAIADYTKAIEIDPNYGLAFY